MPKTRPVSIRMEDDLLKLVRENCGRNFNAYLEYLIMRGMICDLADLHLTFKNVSSNQNSQEQLETLPDLKQIQAGMVFLQEIVFKLALKQGFDEQELKKLYQAIQSQHNQN